MHSVELIEPPLDAPSGLRPSWAPDIYIYIRGDPLRYIHKVTCKQGVDKSGYICHFPIGVS